MRRVDSKKQEEQQNAKQCFSSNLLELLDRKEWTLKEFAERAGVPYNTARNWINGKRLPRRASAYKLCHRLGVSEAALFESGEPVVVAEKKKLQITAEGQNAINLDHLLKKWNRLSEQQQDLLIKIADEFLAVKNVKRVRRKPI